MEKKLQSLLSSALEAISDAKTQEELDKVRIRFLGRKGELTQILRQMKDVAPEKRPSIGQLANEIRQRLETELTSHINEVRRLVRLKQLQREQLDISLPGRTMTLGHKHPLSLILEEIVIIVLHFRPLKHIEPHVQKNISFANLKYTLLAFVREMFGKERRIRLRPSFFPFTEPSAEVDISCFACEGQGCRLCKGTGWLEVLGCGMVHPRVLEIAGYDPTKVSGFAAGMGPDRIAMLKYGIDDIRLFYENDLRFLHQF